MADSTRIRDLMAVATVRRLLLETGHELAPEADGTHVGPLSLWIHQPRDEWNGLTAVQLLAMPDGEERLRLRVRQMVEERHGPASSGASEAREHQ